MKKMFALLLIPALLVMRLAFADVSTTAQGEARFFEPTQEDWNTSAPEIRAQQAVYVAARDKGDYAGARKASVWNFQIAWLWFNEGIALFQGAKGNVTDLRKAQDCLIEARKSADAAKIEGHHAHEWKACLKLLNVNEKSLEKEIAAYLNK